MLVAALSHNECVLVFIHLASPSMQGCTMYNAGTANQQRHQAQQTAIPAIPGLPPLQPEQQLLATLMQFTGLSDTKCFQYLA